MTTNTASSHPPRGARLPLCAQPRHDAALQEVLDGCVALIRAEPASHSRRAVVLTGSFARGEGTVLDRAGHIRVLGDLEFFLISSSARDPRVLEGQLARWSREATTRFGRGPVHVDIEFGALDVQTLQRRGRPSIFLYDLIHHGRVLDGPPDALAAIPPFEAADIPRDDALFLLFNRTIEQLDTYERVPELTSEGLVDAVYQRQKLLLDLAGSALAFRGVHTPSYAERPAAFARLAARIPALVRRLPSHFQRDLVMAAHGKLDPSSPGIAERLPLELGLPDQRAWVRQRLLAAVPLVTAFLTWELEERLTSSAALPVLLAHYLDATSWSQRIRDWAKLALSPVSPPLPLSFTRAARLAWRTTPRAALYVAAALAYVDLRRGPVAPRAIARLLFLARHARPRDAAGQRRAIAALWRWCVRNS